MKPEVWWRFGTILFGSAIMLALFLGARTRAQGPDNPSHLPSDWSHRHMVFSRPDSFWRVWELQKEPRYRHQWVRQNGWALRSANTSTWSLHHDRDRYRDQDREDDDSDRDGPLPVRNPMRRDWAVSLGNLGTVGTGQSPAKFTFDVNSAPSCAADYVAFTTSLAGSISVPSIVAFDNLYATQGSVGGFCNVNGPSVKWAYNTNPPGDTTGTTLTSPVLSLDGTKIAFVESRTSANGGSILHILKWKPGAGATVQGTIAAPAAPDTLMGAGQAWNTTNCPAANSCVANIIFNGAQPDTGSAPFYNYATDELYAGDDNGALHKFTGVFLGTPTEVGAAGGWPITVNAAAILTGPVFDPTSKNIFVADHTGRLSFVKEVGSTTGACTSGSPPCLGSVSQTLTGSVVDPPIVDGGTERVLTFDGTDANNGSVYQFDTALTTGSKVTVNVGGTAVGSALHAGAFDDTYFSVGPASGHFYTCGKDSGNNDRPAIYRLTFNGSGVLSAAAGTPLVGLVLLDGSACSPVTELRNGATDRIFFSVTGTAFPPSFGGNATGCTVGLGCAMSIVLGGAWPPGATTAGIPASGGTSGMVVDNVGGGAQESNLYYTYLSNSNGFITCNGTTGVGCAVKVTQSALQ
jgi:hypothetical protein